MTLINSNKNTKQQKLHKLHTVNSEVFKLGILNSVIQICVRPTYLAMVTKTVTFYRKNFETVIQGKATMHCSSTMYGVSQKKVRLITIAITLSIANRLS